MTEHTSKTAAAQTTAATAKTAPKAAPKSSKAKPKAKPAAARSAPAAPAPVDPMAGFTETMEDAATFQKANIEACLAAGRSWTSGMGALTGAAIEMGKKNYERALQANKEILACDSMQDAFEIRAALAREFLDTSMADATHLSELATKAVKETAEPLQERYNLALDGIWKAA